MNLDYFLLLFLLLNKADFIWKFRAFLSSSFTEIKKKKNIYTAKYIYIYK